MNQLLCTGRPQPYTANSSVQVSRIEVRAGHAAGKPTEKVLAEAADMFSFAAAAMKAPWVGMGTEQQHSSPNGAA
jgi:prolyl oligopeptidase